MSVKVNVPYCSIVCTTINSYEMKNNNIQTEVDAAYLYQKLAEHETDTTIASVFRQMSDIEKGHALAFARKSNINDLQMLKPSWRAKTLNTIDRIFGYDYVLGVLMDEEKSNTNALIANKKRNDQSISGTETTHVNILRSILEKDNKVTGAQISKFEKRHRSVGGNANCAAVLGG